MAIFRHSWSRRLLIDVLAEHRLIPKSLLKKRDTLRRRFLEQWVTPGGVGAEIGVQKGFLTHVLIGVTKPKELHLIDPWYLLGEKWKWATTNQSTTFALRNIIYWFQKELAQGSIVLHIGFANKVLPGIPDHHFDWVYLDASHRYKDTLEELELLQNKIKHDGIILGDDWYSTPGHKFAGQYRAINEFVANTDFELVRADDNDHQWVIRRSG